MARPVEHERRRALAHDAVAVLEREGLELSMAELADRLGMKRPTLLYHFPTRVDLFAEVLVEVLTAQAAAVMAAVARHEHPIDRLYAQLVAVHAFHHGREGRIVFLTQAIAATAGPRVPELLALADAVFASERRAAVERLRAGQAEGLVGPCDPEALAATVRALIDGLLVQRVMVGLDLGPVHAALWTQLFAPLRRPAMAWWPAG
jgi:TetR/AcrR family transcriptional regulator